MILVYGVQTSSRAAHGRIQWGATPQRVAGVCGLIACFLLLGAAAPFLVDAEDAKESVGYGLGWQGVFGQFAKLPGSQP
jgi:hypothetical protein